MLRPIFPSLLRHYRPYWCRRLLLAVTISGTRGLGEDNTIMVLSSASRRAMTNLHTPRSTISSLSRDFRPCCSCRMVLAVTSLESRGFGEEHDVLNSISTWVALSSLCHHAPHIQYAPTAPTLIKKSYTFAINHTFEKHSFNYPQKSHSSLF